MRQADDPRIIDAAGDMVAFFDRLVAILARNERVVLCTTLRLEGSGPRGAGAKMLVRSPGELVGTIGGGLLEAKATAWAQEALGTGRAICRPFLLNLQAASDEGMTCGGEVELLVEPLNGENGALRAFYVEVLALLRRGECGWLATAITEDGDDAVVDHFLLAGGRCVAHTSGLGPSLPEDLFAAAPSAPTLVDRGATRYFLEPVAPPLTVYIFGGGHIAAHLVPLCHHVGLRTVVADDRAEFVSRDRFPQTDELLVVSNFETALDGLPIGETSYVVIVTRGHAGDLAVLRQALRRQPAFIGMIGSARKRALIYEQLAREGVAADALARVACPIGLPIGAETPEEIAVSIAAQLVAVRRGKG